MIMLKLSNNKCKIYFKAVFKRYVSSNCDNLANILYEIENWYQFHKNELYQWTKLSGKEIKVHLNAINTSFDITSV